MDFCDGSRCKDFAFGKQIGESTADRFFIRGCEVHIIATTNR